MGEKYTPAQARATKKYLEQFDKITFRVPIGKKEEYKNAAAAAGKPLNQFIMDCIEKEM